MKNAIVLLFVGLLLILLISCIPTSSEDNKEFALPMASMKDWPISEKIDTFLIHQKEAPDVVNSGFETTYKIQIM